MCDGCHLSFHFECLDPPLDQENPPDGDWYCPKCGTSRFMGQYVDKLKRISRKDFMLPHELRTYFMETRPNDHKDYKNSCETAAPLPKFTGRNWRGSRDGYYWDAALYKTHEKVRGVKQRIQCFGCRLLADGERPTINCDYCPLTFHLDCLDPPMANPPHQYPQSDKAFHNWMCPNHAHHDMVWYNQDENGNAVANRIRRPRNPRLIDVEVLPEPEESERHEEAAQRSILYRVRASALRDAFAKRTRL